MRAGSKHEMGSRQITAASPHRLNSSEYAEPRVLEIRSRETISFTQVLRTASRGAATA